MRPPETHSEHVLQKIREAAIDGQNVSATYALDRLRLIQEYADAELRRQGFTIRCGDYAGGTVTLTAPPGTPPGPTPPAKNN
jgi:hypothetical protein